MITITREQLERLYNQQKKLLSAAVTVPTICLILGIVLRRSYYSEDVSRIIDFVIILLIVVPFIFLGIIRKKLIPPGNGKIVNEAFSYMQQDPISDNTVNMLFQKIGQAGNYADKTKLILLLADVYMFRGQYNEAIGMLNSVDRSGFEKNPVIGMNFYDDTISVYCALEDTQSVMLAYNDAEQFIMKCSSLNYICCHTAVNILINVEIAKGNYQKALEMRLMMNDFANQTNQRTEARMQATPINRIIKGSIFCNTAELFFHCGDYANAAKYLDIGGPMVAECAGLLDEANKLSAKIREKMTDSSAN